MIVIPQPASHSLQNGNRPVGAHARKVAIAERPPRTVPLVVPKPGAADQSDEAAPVWFGHLETAAHIAFVGLTAGAMLGLSVYVASRFLQEFMRHDFLTLMRGNGLM